MEEKKEPVKLFRPTAIPLSLIAANSLTWFFLRLYPTHHTMAWVRRNWLALVPTYFSAQILCAFPSRNITSTTTSYCLHCLHCLHWLQCLQSTTLPPKSLQRSPAVGDFYGTGIEIWAGFGQNGWIASKSFDPWNHHIPQIKGENIRHILMY